MFGDPLLVGGIGLEEVLIVLFKTVVTFGVMLGAVILMIWFERKLIADLQNRVGPNLAGPFGILQTLADGIKLIFKQDLIPSKADRIIFAVAPFLAMVPAFLSFSIVPLGGDFQDKGGVVSWFGRDTYFQLADPQVGFLLLLAMSSIGVYGMMLAGWSSGSKYPLISGVRATAQAISYEAALGLSLVSVLIVSGSLSTHDIVASQAGEGWLGIVPSWNLVVTGVVPFVIFLIAATAELARTPFDLVEAEQELTGGYNTEYSSIRFGHFYLAEYMNLITMSSIMVTLFLGGPAGPIFGPSFLHPVLPTVWFVLKVLVFLFAAVWTRATLPRFRYDQLMDLGWKVLIPLSLGWLLLLATIQVGRDQDWNLAIVILISLGVLFLGTALLTTAISTARRARVSEEVS
ncbi:NADH-quinone oxidoreductase subunit NuoH [Actinomarinicola tropica]|uniref:NADH-quinone oxidoreductase subunit H n=1 Tax=Actinomarinicola tropica TaxID=2789776 RepID=A0A5Q2RAG8_9ACTN|nr:NADH-quinone oxidoreductase subunit NuoH [Actinomarinicola tropica]QGG93808.1 NADH-quinone oxidoreductase subunit NuoH [Actinomarinicola tropica]